MKEMAPSHINNYFTIWHGNPSYLHAMPKETHSIIFQALESGEAVGQYVMPFFRPQGDMQITMPERVREKESFKEAQLAKVRLELDHM